jgi:hypothetical protein
MTKRTKRAPKTETTPEISKPGCGRPEIYTPEKSNEGYTPEAKNENYTLE